jgi:predicted GNAT family N-acyltransferase
MHIKIREPQTAIDYMFLRNIRIQVFVIEQQIPWKWEFDEFDTSAIHLIVEINQQIIGTGRFYPSSNDESIYKLGRMAVLKNFRGLGIGTKILNKFEDIAKSKNISEIYLEAQSDKLSFYLKQNYVPKGDKYIMDGIYHNLMSKTIL